MPDANEQQKGGTAVRSKPEPPKQDFLPQFRVLLHNDDKNPMDHVVNSLVGLARLEQMKAVGVMLEAHSTGVALVLTTHKERAELLQEQFASKGLITTIEPVE